MPFNPEFAAAKVHGSEKPEFVPKVEYVGTPEQYKLPYKITIDQEKLALFMEGLGIPKDKIDTTKISVSYKPARAGGITKTSGDVTIYAGQIQRNTLLEINGLVDTLSGKKEPFTKKAGKFAASVKRFIAKQMMFELNEKGMADSLPHLDEERKQSLSDVAERHGMGSEELNAAMETQLREIVDHYTRLAVPHEMIHSKQYQVDHALKRKIATFSLAAVGEYALSKLTGRLLWETEGIRAKFGNIAGKAASAAVNTADVYGFMKLIYYARKFQGLETAAYRDMKHYDELFKQVIRIEPTDMSFEAALDASAKKENYKKAKTLKHVRQVQVGTYDARSGASGDAS